MKLTLEQMIDAGCCDGAEKYFVRDKTRSAKSLLKQSIKQGDYHDARYGLAYMMTHRQQVEWAIYCAESCLPVYENSHNSKAPRAAIEAAKAWLLNPKEKNATAAAYAAAYAAAAAAAYAAAAYAAANAAYVAAYAAYAVAAANAAAYAAAAYAAASATRATNGANTVELLWKGYEILTVEVYTGSEGNE